MKLGVGVSKLPCTHKPIVCVCCVRVSSIVYVCLGGDRAHFRGDLLASQSCLPCISVSSEAAERLKTWHRFESQESFNQAGRTGQRLAESLPLWEGWPYSASYL